MSQSKEEVVQEFRIRSIQEAALRVIARKGMSAATMQEIASEAGVAKGTIYLYFRDRDELVEKTFDNAIKQLHARVDAAIALDEPFDQKLRAVIRAKLAFFSENAEFFRLYLSLRMPEGSPQQQRRQKKHCQPEYQSRVDAVATMLEQAMEQGEIRRVDPKRLALFIIEGSTAIVLQRITEDAPPPEEHDLDVIVDTILDGISFRKQKRSSH
jgi:AcrR family transcriptional regulator